jgi:hypothetical protein
MMFAAVAAVVVAGAVAGCGPAAHSSALRTTSAASAPATTATTPPATPRPKPRVVAPKPSPTPTPTPTPKPVSRPKSTPKPVAATCGAPANPWGYNFCSRGSLIYTPAAGVCGYFNCIDNFGNGSGYMVECNDGMYSMSGGRRGACSYHSGEGQPVYGGP